MDNLSLSNKIWCSGSSKKEPKNSQKNKKKNQKLQGKSVCIGFCYAKIEETIINVDGLRGKFAAITLIPGVAAAAMWVCY